MKKFIVQKFGGTSVGSLDRLLSLRSIIENSLTKYSPILVVSAVSGSTKAEGTTSLLLASIEEAILEKDFSSYINSIKLQHIGLVETLSLERKNKFLNFLDLELEKLTSFLSALSTIGEKSPRSEDYVLSFGERLSACLVTELLLDNGINVRMCDLSSIVDSNTVFEEESFYDQISDRIIKEIRPEINEVLVVTGFFGYLSEGLIGKVGRGYSDLTAALVAKGLGSEKVEELQIWKEVDGVFSADPRKVSGARVLKEISAEEAVELTFFGSEVLHPYTMEQVISKNIPIRVLNSLKPESVGTIIKKQVDSVSGHPTAVTVKKGVIILSVTSNRMYDAKGFLAQLFEILRAEGLVVDLVSTSEVTVSCTVNDLARLKLALPKLTGLGEIRVLEDRAILAVVGVGMNKDRESAGKMFTALSESKIYPEMITQAESSSSISCVLASNEVENALNIVHTAIFNSSN